MLAADGIYMLFRPIRFDLDYLSFVYPLDLP